VWPDLYRAPNRQRRAASSDLQSELFVQFARPALSQAQSGAPGGRKVVLSPPGAPFEPVAPDPAVAAAAHVAQLERRFQRSRIHDAMATANSPRLAALTRAFRAAETHWDRNASRWRAPFVRPPIPARVVPLGDAFTRREQRRLDLARETEFREKAEAVYSRLVGDETGVSRSSEKQAEAVADEILLLDQTHSVAKRLEKMGVPTYRSGMWGLWHYGVHSGTVSSDPRFRRLCLLPYMAKRIRQPMLNALEAWFERHPFARLWTFTGGKRCRLSDVRERFRYIFRKLSRLNAEPFMREAGVSIVFRSGELGTPECSEDGTMRPDHEAGCFERDEGGVWFHPHIHCAVELTKGQIPKHRWARLLKSVWAFWGHHWDDGRAVRNARELCKYVSKPGEVLALTDPELAELHRQLFRLKIMQPMGSLAADIKRRDECRLRLVRERTREGCVWQEAPDWARGVPGEDGQEFDDEVWMARERDFVHVDGKELLRLEHAANAARARNWSDGAQVCRVVSKSAPAWSPLGVKEPRVVVMGTYFDAAFVASHPLVQRLRETTAAEWQAGVAIRVHTGTPTVRELAPEFGFVPNRDPRPPPEPALAGPSEARK